MIPSDLECLEYILPSESVHTIPDRSRVELVVTRDQWQVTKVVLLFKDDGTLLSVELVSDLLPQALCASLSQAWTSLCVEAPSGIAAAIVQINTELEELLDSVCTHKIPSEVHLAQKDDTPPPQPSSEGYDSLFYGDPGGVFATQADVQRLAVVRTGNTEVHKSVFFAHAARVRSGEDSVKFLQWLKRHRDVAGATHNICACIIDSGEYREEFNDDDGETGASSGVLFMMDKMAAVNAIVVVTRHYGGVKLGPQRFKIIKDVARDAIALLLAKSPK